MTTALIDADVVVYMAANAAEKAIDWGDDIWTLYADAAEARDIFRREVDKVQEAVEADDVIICLSDRNGTFRHSLWPAYKGNRSSRKPLVYRHLRDWIETQTEWRTYLRPNLEADDVMGILATHPKIVPGRKVICTIDKDLRQIPGFYYNMDGSGLVEEISEAAADYYLFMQALTGDTIDNYPGCPGIGPVRAKTILAKAWTIEDEEFDRGTAWRAVVAAYEKAGLTADDAALQFTLARILRADDYDFQKKEPKVWPGLN